MMWLSASQIAGHGDPDIKIIWSMTTFILELNPTHKNLKQF